MLLNTILFPLFIGMFFLIGISFINILSKIIYKSEYNNKAQLDGFGIMGFMGLFAIGALSLFYNFFAPIYSLFFYIVLGGFLIHGIYILARTISNYDKNDFLIFLAIAVAFSIYSASMNPGYDGGLYHLPHQLWLRTESIVIGLANLHGRLGFSSIYEYISAPFWLKGENFILLSYLQTSFIVFFGLFLIDNIKKTFGPHKLLVIGIILNIFLFRDYLLFEYTGTDMPAGLLFASAFIYGSWIIFSDSSINRIDWTIFATLTLFSFFLKASSILVFTWFIFVLIYRIYWKNDKFSEIVIGTYIPIIFLIIWIIKNIISTGCLLYPVSFSCLNIPWNAEVNAINDSNSITAWARHPQSGLYSLEDNSWFFNWWFPEYRSFLLKLLGTGLFISIFYSFIAYKNKINNIKMFDIRIFASSGFLILSLLLWFWKAPTPRFGIGVFILLFPVLLLFIIKNNNQIIFNINKYIKKGIVFISILFVIYICLYWNKVSNGNLFIFDPITVPNIVVIEDEVYGFRPKQGDQCWLAPKCAPYDRPPKKIWKGKTVFYPNK